MSKAQTCSFFGWSRDEFDRRVAKGFPARKASRSRGAEWEVDSRDAVEWVVDQEVARRAERRPARPAPADRGEPPPWWEAFKAAERVEDPLEGVGMVNILWLIYALPRLIANLAFDEGVGLDRTWKISVGTVLLALEHCRQRLDYWPKDEDAVGLLDEAFEGVNWPYKAVKAGRPDWRPPVYGLGWGEVEPDYFAECVAHGEAIEEKYRLTEERDAAARADA